MIRAAIKSNISAPMRDAIILGAPPIFNPRSVAGLEFWHDASDASKFTLSGSDIISFADSSGNGHTVDDQGVPAQRPQRINGNEVSFDGTTRLVDSSFANAMDGLSDFTVLLLASDSNLSTSWYATLSNGTGGDTLCFSLGSDQGNRYRYAYSGASQFSSPTEFYQPTGVATNVLRSIVYRRDWAGGTPKIDIFVDGAKFTGLTPTVTASILNGTHLVYGALRAVSGINPQIGGTRQAMGYRRALSDAEVASLLLFIDSKR